MASMNRSQWSALSIQDRIRAMNDTLDHDAQNTPKTTTLDSVESSNGEEVVEHTSPKPQNKRTSVVDMWRQREELNSPRAAMASSPRVDRTTSSASDNRQGEKKDDPSAGGKRQEEKKDDEGNQNGQSPSVRELRGQRTAAVNRNGDAHAPQQAEEAVGSVTPTTTAAMQKRTPQSSPWSRNKQSPVREEQVDLNIVPSKEDEEEHGDRQPESKNASPTKLWAERMVQHLDSSGSMEEHDNRNSCLPEPADTLDKLDSERSTKSPRGNVASRWTERIRQRQNADEATHDRASTPRSKVESSAL